MKNATCPKCGSPDIICQNNSIVCKKCDAKYSFDNNDQKTEARLSEIQLLFSKAKKAYYDDSDFDTTEFYCNKILDIDSTYPLAWLLKAFVAGWSVSFKDLNMDDFFLCIQMAFSNAATPKILTDIALMAEKERDTFSLAIYQTMIKKIETTDDWKKYHGLATKHMIWEGDLQILFFKAFSKFYEDVPESEKVKPINLSKENKSIDMCFVLKDLILKRGINLWVDTWTEYTSAKGTYKYESAFEKMKNSGLCAILMVDYLIPKDINEASPREKELAKSACEAIINMKTLWVDLKSETKCFNSDYKKRTCIELQEHIQMMSELDPSFVVPPLTKTTIQNVTNPPAQTSSGGCYVATCVYGSYDCPQVWTLRRYRDDTLGATWYGRAFIKTYYAISPTLVKWFGDTKWFKKMWKGKLDRMVKKLQAEGIENTPYEDKQW